MVTLKQLVERVDAKISADIGGIANEDMTREIVECAVRATIAGLGFYIVEATGEVGDPRPAPVTTYPNNVQHQVGVRWRGGRRR